MKKFISLLIAMTMCMSLFAVSVAAETESFSIDFSEPDVGYRYQNLNGSLPQDGSLAFVSNGEVSETNCAEVVASGSETYGNCLKVVTGVSAWNAIGYQIKDTSKYAFTMSFNIKFEDMNERRNVSIQYQDGSYTKSVTDISFSTDGTVSICGDVMDDFVYESGRWYRVDFGFTGYNGVKFKITDDKGIAYADVGYLYTYLGYSGYPVQRIAIAQTNTNGGGVFYLDNINVAEWGSMNDRVTFEDFDAIAVNTSLGDTATPANWWNKATSYNFSYKLGDTASTMTVVERETGDNALKVTKTSETSAGSTLQSWTLGTADMQYQNAVAEFDIKLADNKVNRELKVKQNSGSEIALVKFGNDGTVTVGSTVIPGFAYEYGANAPWYNVKCYISVSSSNLIAVISDGENQVTGYGTYTKSGDNGFNQLYIYVRAGGNASETYIDNIKLREYFPASDFFAARSYFSFDDLTAENKLPTGYSASSYSNWSVFNNNAGTVEGTGEVINGRKALKVTRLTSDSRTNTTLRFSSMTNEPISAIDKIQFDVNKPVSNLGVAGDMIFVGDACVATISDGQKIKINGTEYDFTFGDWHRIAVDFNLGETTYTYNIKVINLDKNTLVAETQNITTTLTALPTSFQYLSGMPNGEYFYIDNVYMSGSDNKTYNLEQTWLENDVLPHLGAALTFNQSINSASALNEITLNGVKYTGADANAFLDASEFGTVRLAGLEGETSYDVEYKLYDMFGNAAEGKTRFTTGESYTFGDITLSEETLQAGEITASITGKISADMEASLIFALYEKGSNRMSAVKLVNIGYSKVEDTYTATLDVPAEGEYEVRAFLWDDAMSPIKAVPVTLAQ